MSDTNLDNLNVLENKILEFGNKFSMLLIRIQEYLNGKLLNSNVNEREFEYILEEILNNIISIKDEMHKQVDEIYKENRLNHLTKLHNDLIEQSNALVELKSRLKYIKIV